MARTTWQHWVTYMNLQVILPLWRICVNMFYSLLNQQLFIYSCACFTNGKLTRCGGGFEIHLDRSLSLDIVVEKGNLLILLSILILWTTLVGCQCALIKYYFGFILWDIFLYLNISRTTTLIFITWTNIGGGGIFNFYII